MSASNIYRASPPQKLFENYKNIVNSNLIRSKELSDDNITEFEFLLNQVQPQTDEEHCMRSFVQYLYRKNPGHFTRFIQRSSLNHLVLWTEAKFMVRIFELRGLVYIKWDVDQAKYVCSMHRTVSEYLNSGECSSMEEVVNRITQETEDQERSNRDRRPRRDFNDNGNNRIDRGYGKGDHHSNYRDQDNRVSRPQQRNYSDRDNGNSRRYDNRRSHDRTNRTNQRPPTERDFPVLTGNRVVSRGASWPKECNTRSNTPSQSVCGSTDDEVNETTVDLTASFAVSVETEL
jgi:hypothetical protein